MNTNRYLIASLAVAVWLLLYGFVVNTIVLAEFWAANTATGLMRAEGEEQMWAVLVSCLLQGFALGYIFTRGYEHRGIGEGVRFGLLMIWLVGAIYLLLYALQPFTLAGLLVSVIADGIMYVGAGVLLALLYKPASG